MKPSRISRSKKISFFRKNLNQPTLVIFIATVITVSLAASLTGRTSSIMVNRAPKALLSDYVSVQAAGRGNPWINLTDGHDVLTEYTGTAAMLESDLSPSVLASGDFDGDGVPDLVSGYSTRGGGFLTIHRGNVDSIYPNTPEASRRKASGAFTDSPFLSPASVVEVAAPPDFIQAGDFNADGYCDVVVASRGSNELYFLPGDGEGTLGAAQAIALPGTVTTLASGDVNRADGLIDLIVGIEGVQGPKLMVFEGPAGAIASTPEVLDLPDEAKAIAIGRLDDDYLVDLAIAAGPELLIVHGRDRKLSLDEKGRAAVRPALVSHRSFPSTLTSLAFGYFTSDERPDLAVLSKDGTVELVTVKNNSIRQKEILATGLPSSEGALICARVSSLSHENLVMTDPGSRQLRIWMDDAERRARGDVTLSAVGRQPSEPVTLNVEGEPVAVLPMRLNDDALSDLVILRSGHVAPSTLQTQAVQTFCVTTTNDCNNCGSLRDAITAANNNAGMDTINFGAAFNGVQTIQLSGPLPNITEAVNVVGVGSTTCGSGSGVSKVALNGGNSVTNAFNIASGGARVANFVINRFTNGVQISQGRSSIVEVNVIGNSTRGVFLNNSGGNTIGGTTSASLNIITGNGVGIEISGNSASGNMVKSNRIGMDAAGQVVGNGDNGISITNGATSNTIGGPTPTPGTALNVIDGNNDGVAIFSGGGNLVQSNIIELNRHNGVTVNTMSNTIGGTTNALINGIWRSSNNGVELNGAGETDNLVQGNLIGITFDTNNAIVNKGNQQHGVAILNGSSGNIIGGASDSAANIIALNRGDGVSVASGNRNGILSDRITANGGLGIRLQPGANDNQASPVLTSAVFSKTAAAAAFENDVAANPVGPAAAGLTVAVSFNSTPNQTFTLQFFFGGDCACTGPQCISSIPVPLKPDAQVMTDPTGKFTGSFTFPDFVLPSSGGFVNATATNSANSTSQFSQCIQVSTSAASCAPTCPATPAPVPATSSSGAIVSFTTPSPPSGCTGVTVTCAPPSNSTFPIGVTTVTCTASDSSGSRGSCSFSVTVTAPAGPTITSACKAEGKRLVINGTGFSDDAKVFIQSLTEGGDFNPEKTEFVSSTQVVAFKAGKRTFTGDKIKVRTGGVDSAAFTYTRVNCP